MVCKTWRPKPSTTIAKSPTPDVCGSLGCAFVEQGDVHTLQCECYESVRNIPKHWTIAKSSENVFCWNSLHIHHDCFFHLRNQRALVSFSISFYIFRNILEKQCGFTKKFLLRWKSSKFHNHIAESGGYQSVKVHEQVHGVRLLDLSFSVVLLLQAYAYHESHRHLRWSTLQSAMYRNSHMHIFGMSVLTISRHPKKLTELLQNHWQTYVIEFSILPELTTKIVSSIWETKRLS